MFRVLDQFANHGLDDSNVSIQSTTQDSAKKRDPERRGKPHEEQRQHGAKASQKQNGLAADPVRQTTPEHAAQGLSQRKRRNQDAGIKRRVAIGGHVEILHHHPGIGQDGSQGDRLCDSTYRCNSQQCPATSLRREHRRGGGNIPKSNSWIVGKPSVEAGECLS